LLRLVDDVSGTAASERLFRIVLGKDRRCAGSEAVLAAATSFGHFASIRKGPDGRPSAIPTKRVVFCCTEGCAAAKTVRRQFVVSGTFVYRKVTVTCVYTQSHEAQ